MGLRLVVSNEESQSLNELSGAKRPKRTASPMNSGLRSLIKTHEVAFAELVMVSPELARLLHRRTEDWIRREIAYRAAGFSDHDTND